ncbi:MAG: hypothetical protein P1U70_09045, partial [Saprospiraceae bacterium]|nr:hypothetical protein [Saprospiraceae bacterium]
MFFLFLLYLLPSTQAFNENIGKISFSFAEKKLHHIKLEIAKTLEGAGVSFSFLPPISMEVIPAGSYIINMGVQPQTEENALKPYGLIWELLQDHLVPIKWAINPGKIKDGVDFTYNNIDYKGGPFIVLAEYRSIAVN